MAANEIAERLAASAWVQCGSDGGESLADFDPGQLRFRSLVGFQNRIITTNNGSLVPLIILPLDRTLSRAECAVFAHRIATAGPTGDQEETRQTYPVYDAPAASYAQVFCEPIMLSWLGDDLTAPAYMPFGLFPGPVSVPDDQPLDTFDALAVVLPSDAGVAFAGDFCVLVLKHPKIEGETIVQAVLPAEVP